MNIFWRRPLSLILCIALGAFSLFSKIASPYTYVLWGLAGLLLCLSFVKPSIHIKRGLIRACAIAFLISSLISHFYFGFYYKAYERYYGTVKISGEISEIDDNAYYTYLTVKVKEINGESVLDYKFLVMLDSEEISEAPEFKIGKNIELCGKISDFNNKNSDFNANSYYLSKGYSAKIKEPFDFVLSGEQNLSISAFFSDKRRDISEYIIENSNEEAGGLLVALLLGEKEYLSPETELDFRRIGISHILALSGLHLAILAIGFGKLLSFFGVGKKLRTLFTLCFTLLYMAITGFPISVVRAGIMLILASLLYLLANASDSFTNLSLSVFLIVLISPYSIFDVSLLLSAFATLGIVALGDLPRDNTKKRGLKNVVLNSITVSLFAISATFLISVLSFNEISVISPISTLIFSVLVEIFLYFGTFYVVFTRLLPLGNILIFLGDVIKNLAARFSKLDYISVSTDYSFVTVLAAVFTLLFFAFLVFNVKHRRIGVAVISSLMSLILISGALLSYNTQNQTRITYNLSENGDAILMTQDGEITVFENKAYTSARVYETLRYLKDEKLTRLDNYILTDYNSNMKAALYSLMSEVKVTNVYLPKPQSADEYKIYTDILSLNDVFSVNLFTYGNEAIKFSGFYFIALYRDTECGVYQILHENKKYLIASSGILENNGANLALKRILDSDYVIFSRYGKEYRDYNFSYLFEKPQVFIFSSKKLYVPASVKNYYENSGAEIIRTPERYDFIR